MTKKTVKCKPEWIVFTNTILPSLFLPKSRRWRARYRIRQNRMSRCINSILSMITIQALPVHASVRLYSRWAHRSPAKVLLPFEPNSKRNLKNEKVIDLDPSILNKIRPKDIETNKLISPKNEQSSLTPEKSEQIKLKREERLKKQKFYISQQKVFGDNGEIIYEKLKENDSRVSNLLLKLKSKKERSRSSQALVEGWRLIVDGLEANCTLKYVIFSRTTDLDRLRPFLPKTGVKFYKIPYKEVQLWSDVETSPGIFGVFQKPTAENIKIKSKALPLQLICDNIRVPGNLGAILRVAVGTGCEKVLLTNGCVDLWDPKVIRSAAGAHFRLPIYNSIEWTEMPSYLEQDTSIFIAESNTNTEDSLKEIEIIGQNEIPVVPYYSIDFSTFKHTTLIIGGETEGISEESYSIAANKNGVRLNIPLQKGVDSLNTGMATAVIAFEIKKQLIQAWSKEKLKSQMATV